MDVGSWMVVRVLKRSPLTAEEQAIVAQLGGASFQGWKPRHSMQQQQQQQQQQQGREVGQQQEGTGRQPGGEGKQPGGADQGKGAGTAKLEQEAGVVTGMAGQGGMMIQQVACAGGSPASGSGVAGIYGTGHRMGGLGSISPDETASPEDVIVVDVITRGSSPSEISPEGNSPTTLTGTHSPISSSSAMSVDVQSSIGGSRAAAAAMDVAGTGAAVSADDPAARPGSISPPQNPHPGISPAAFLLPNAGPSSQATQPQLLHALYHETMPSFKHYLFENKQPSSSRAGGTEARGDREENERVGNREGSGIVVGSRDAPIELEVVHAWNGGRHVQSEVRMGEERRLLVEEQIMGDEQFMGEERHMQAEMHIVEQQQQQQQERRRQQQQQCAAEEQKLRVVEERVEWNTEAGMQAEGQHMGKECLMGEETYMGEEQKMRVVEERVQWKTKAGMQAEGQQNKEKEQQEQLYRHQDQKQKKWHTQQQREQQVGKVQRHGPIQPPMQGVLGQVAERMVTPSGASTGASVQAAPDSFLPHTRTQQPFPSLMQAPSPRATHMVSSHWQQAQSPRQHGSHNQVNASSSIISPPSGPLGPFIPPPSPSASAASSAASQPHQMPSPGANPTAAAVSAATTGPSAVAEGEARAAEAAGSAAAGAAASSEIRAEDLQALADLLNSLMASQAATATAANAANSAVPSAAVDVQPLRSVTALIPTDTAVIPTGTANSGLAGAQGNEFGGLVEGTAMAGSRQLARAHSVGERSYSVAGVPSALFGVLSTGAQQGKRHKGQQGAGFGHEEQQWHQQRTQLLQQIQQPHHQQKQQQYQQILLQEQQQQPAAGEAEIRAKYENPDELSADIPWHRSVSCPVVSLPHQAPSPGTNQPSPTQWSDYMPFRASHSLGEGEQGRGGGHGGATGSSSSRNSERFYHAQSLLHTAVRETGGGEMGGAREGGEERGGEDGGDNGLEAMIRSITWHEGAERTEGTGVRPGAEGAETGTGVRLTGAEGVEAGTGVQLAGVERTEERRRMEHSEANRQGIGEEAAGIAAGGVAAGGVGAAGVGAAGVAAAVVSRDAGAELTALEHGVGLVELEALLLELEGGLINNIAGVSIPNNSMLGVTMGPPDALLLPESFFLSPAVACTTGETRTDETASAPAAEAAAAAVGTSVDVAGKPQMEIQAASSSRGSGKRLSPKRCHDEVVVFEASKNEEP
ncbi:hypothetical protein CLOM_g22518 [Closterium sp. NIES-68]|nr:hypothetical protein CLOM_g22518 [Closterium sp. NIES-68]